MIGFLSLRSDIPLPEEAEASAHLGRPARITGGAVRFLMGALALPLIPVAWLLAPVHKLLGFLTMGLYTSAWNAAWLPVSGAALATSRLWSHTRGLWPLWLLLGLPFVVASHVVALLGPQDGERSDRATKLTAVRSWPYTYFVMFEWESPSYSVPTGAGAYDGLASFEIGVQPRRKDS